MSPEEQLALGEDGWIVLGRDMRAQLRQTLEELKAALQKRPASLGVILVRLPRRTSPRSTSTSSTPTSEWKTTTTRCSPAPRSKCAPLQWGTTVEIDAIQPLGEPGSAAQPAKRRSLQQHQQRLLTRPDHQRSEERSLGVTLGGQPPPPTMAVERLREIDDIEHRVGAHCTDRRYARNPTAGRSRASRGSSATYPAEN